MSKRPTMTPRRLLVASFSALALVGGVVAAPSLATAAPSAGGSASKIAPELATALDADGSASFWVRFAARADLSAAQQIDDWDARGTAVYRALKATARESQADVAGLLVARGVSYESYFIANAIHVTAGDRALADEIAAAPGVSELLVLGKPELIEPVQRTAAPVGPAAPEWGLLNIKADQVWSTFGVRGETIVVANIDTGVQYNHPALVAQYRGNKGGGTFNHNRSWFDAQGSAGAPYDTNGHGTHTMGTMVGDDGGANQIGVAPKAKWITANGCCPSWQAILDSAQWMLAPTKLDGSRPRAKKRPHVINNSYGSSGSSDPIMDSVIAAWEASGIFGMFSNGNGGPSCSTAGTPGGRTVAYSAGAYDISNNIASFSSRGPGQSGTIKPNIAAPGVNVRSSLPGGAYGNLSGTSMSSPHVAGAVALLWSAEPAVKRDITATETLLDNTAIDVSSLACGGTADDNNVFGEGRLDALALVTAAALRE